jgi:superfamily II DNA or RNA helicase
MKYKIHGNIGAMLEVKHPPAALKKELLRLFTFDNPAYLQASRFSPWGSVSSAIPEQVFLSWEDAHSSSVHLPRGIEIDEFSAKSKLWWKCIHWRDHRTDAPVEFPALLIALNKEQKLLIRELQRLLAHSKAECPFGNLFFVAPTSIGKTIFQALAAKETGQRTLVLCLTELIKRSWYDDLYKAFGLAPKDIGIIQRDKWRIGEHFTIASVMTLAKRVKRWDELFKQIGTVVIDEADVMSAPSIHSFLLNCPAKYLIGASATTNSKNFYLRSVLGSPRKRLMSQNKDTANSLALKEVEVVTTQFQYETEPDTMIDWHDLSECLMDDFKRTKLIIRKALRDYNDGETVGIVTKRVAHAQILFEMMREEGIDDANLLTGSTNANKFYTEKLVDAVLSKNCRMLITTEPVIRRGANLNPLSTLHLAMPVVSAHNLEQLIGRIRRRAIGKETCRLVYYLDQSVPYLRRVFYMKAMSVFRKLKVPGWENKYIA